MSTIASVYKETAFDRQFKGGNALFAVFINMAAVLLGSALGLLLKGRFSPRTGSALMKCLGLCTLGIGFSSLLGTADTLCVILCMVPVSYTHLTLPTIVGV